ncbi:F-box protein At3g07870-like [Papaver somniferum]|uniref:F-box protein At3g07870-like n=1 Tax=Papaver somniferum TaxID=3469 RepID=UPI000E6FB59D|nr:F-box protein At3g07870-like [Papaver somniferum]
MLIESLPIEVLETIFTRLPSVSTLQCRQVSRTWRTIIRRVCRNKLGLLFAFEGISSTRKNQREVQLYDEDRVRHAVNNLEKYDFGETLVYGPDYREASLQTLEFDNSIVCSCSGLVCFPMQNTLVGNPGFIICNPVTGEYGFLGGSRTMRQNLNFASEGGFGCIQSTKEYKVVYYGAYSRGGTHAYVYTLGSRVQWRRIINENIPYTFESSAIFANGAIHWLDSPKDCAPWWLPKVNIVAFDLVDEKFKSVPLPPLGYVAIGKRRRLVSLGGNLCLVIDNIGSQLALV